MLFNQSSEGFKDQSIDFEINGDDLQFVQETYKSFFQRKLHCIYAHDLDGNFLDANEATLNLLGYSRQEILAVNFADLIEKDQFGRTSCQKKSERSCSPRSLLQK